MLVIVDLMLPCIQVNRCSFDANKILQLTILYIDFFMQAHTNVSLGYNLELHDTYQLLDHIAPLSDRYHKSFHSQKVTHTT